MKAEPSSTPTFQSLASKLRQKKAALACTCGCRPAGNSAATPRHANDPPFKRRLRLARDEPREHRQTALPAAADTD